MSSLHPHQLLHTVLLSCDRQMLMAVHLVQAAVRLGDIPVMSAGVPPVGVSCESPHHA